MSTVQLPIAAPRVRTTTWQDRCGGCGATEAQRLLLYNHSGAATRVLLERCFECIPARSVLNDEHCVPSALVDAREVRNLAACKTLGISSKSQAGAAEPALPALIACTAAQR